MSERLPKATASSPRRVVTPAWLKERRAAAEQVWRNRAENPEATTTLLIPAAQHPLLDGVRPGPEFELRLARAARDYHFMIENGLEAECFVAGSRHHDTRSGQTDRVALYDAAGLWLMENEGVPPEHLHGKDWMDKLGMPTVYNGAQEIQVAAAGYLNDSRFQDSTYYCSPGQASRARMYGLAEDFPVEVVVPDELTAVDGKQFHGGIAGMILNGLTNTIDPYGQLLTNSPLTRSRFPTDGHGVGTVPELLPQYAQLPWYQNPAGPEAPTA